jgi:hypothetical protein
MGKASRLKAQRRLQRQSGESALLRRVRASDVGAKMRILKNAAGVEKMSQVIEDFAEPLLDQCSRTEQQRGVIGLATIAWNLSLLPEEKLQQELNEKILPKLGPKMGGILASMVRRKQELYPNNQRPILDYEFTETGPDSFLLNVVSPIPREKIPADQLGESPPGQP